MVLALQWSEAHGCFLIHGLWPVILGVPHHIVNQPIRNPYVVSNGLDWTLLNEMAVVWPDVIHRNNYQLWQHEWDVHGTRSGLSFENYFRVAVELYRSLGPRRVQLVTSLTFSKGDEATLRQIHMKIYEQTGLVVAIKTGPRKSSCFNRMTEIYVGVDRMCGFRHITQDLN
ncbi:uncharacterized protein LOC131009883 [Salvia miltiorrhiza]|uniref:uncharacterized protein LOC131009883 n=1 Tax=Salvia miltiorrhiza TaxID=226208 RepID=UPI0025ABF4C2|nr:uncharacterized protein LOC131009883 [Salvia miltiorrhiza]